MPFAKPSSLALAAMLALATFGAHAQSQVKVYGLLDLSLGSSQDAGIDKPVKSAIDSGKMSTSYYGLSGSEDLGGGLSGLFKLEGFMRADTGAQGRFDGDAQFSRTASVGLSHKDYGTLTLGRNTTALFSSTLSFNAFGDSFGYSPSIRHYFGSGQNAVTGDTGWNDSVAYASPNWNGLRFGVAAAASEASPGNGGNWSVNLGYAQGPLAAALVIQDVEKDGATAVADTHTTQLNASYDFGLAKAFAQYAKVENRSSGIDTTLTGLGVRVPAGKGAVIAQWGQSSPDTGAERNTTSVGYLYPLSKLTELYAVAMKDEIDGLPGGHSYSAGMRLRF